MCLKYSNGIFALAEYITNTKPKTYQTTNPIKNYKGLELGFQTH